MIIIGLEKEYRFHFGFAMQIEQIQHKLNGLVEQEYSDNEINKIQLIQQKWKQRNRKRRDNIPTEETLLDANCKTSLMFLWERKIRTKQKGKQTSNKINTNVKESSKKR